MFRKLFALVISSMIATTAYADSSSLNLALPSIPNNYQYDKFRSGELDCSNAIGSATQLEFGVTGIINDDFLDDNKDVGVYGRIVIPLGARAKERINCNELYELELRRKRLEVMKLEQELQQLRELQFEN
jgi:hypothetical protein